MIKPAITAFSMAYAVGAAKHLQDGTRPPAIKHELDIPDLLACMSRINRKPVRNPTHPRHQRRNAGVSARQYRNAMRFVSRFYAAQGSAL